MAAPEVQRRQHTCERVQFRRVEPIVVVPVTAAAVSAGAVAAFFQQVQRPELRQALDDGAHSRLVLDGQRCQRTA